MDRILIYSEFRQALQEWVIGLRGGWVIGLVENPQFAVPPLIVLP
jgi:hypothetical protein